MKILPIILLVFAVSSPADSRAAPSSWGDLMGYSIEAKRCSIEFNTSTRLWVDTMLGRLKQDEVAPFASSVEANFDQLEKMGAQGVILHCWQLRDYFHAAGWL